MDGRFFYLFVYHPKVESICYAFRTCTKYWGVAFYRTRVLRGIGKVRATKIMNELKGTTNQRGRGLNPADAAADD